MSRIQKSSSFTEISSYDKAYWWAKTPTERLEAARNLIRYAKALYKANPANKPLSDGGHLFNLIRLLNEEGVGRRPIRSQRPTFSHFYYLLT